MCTHDVLYSLRAALDAERRREDGQEQEGIENDILSVGVCFGGH